MVKLDWSISFVLGQWSQDSEPGLCTEIAEFDWGTN